MRSNLCWLSCVVFFISVLPLDLIFVKACYSLEWDRICVGFLVVFFISVLPLDLIFMIACYLCWVEVSLCRCSCVVCYISVLPLDLIFVKACYFLEWDRICVGFLVLYFYISIAFWSHFCDSVLSFGMRSNLCWLPCVTLFFFLYCRWRKYPISKLDIIKPATFRAYPNAWHGFPTP
jgi:hypothetical protein